MTFGNVDLHLIKGRPAVHDDDDLIVSHIAITVSDMSALKKRLEDMKVPSRKNVSVPNPSDSDTGVVEQQFVRDPDGYYIECCNCERLEKYLHEKMAEDAGKWNFSVAKSVMNLKGKKSQRVKTLGTHSVKAATRALARRNILRDLCITILCCLSKR